VGTVWRLRDRFVKDAGRAIQQIQKALTTMNIRSMNDDVSRRRCSALTATLPYRRWVCDAGVMKNR
jgi:hypothetical protein